MDGFADVLMRPIDDRADGAFATWAKVAPDRQRTLASSIGCAGIGLHTGASVRMVLHPAPPGQGIGFTRTDLLGTAPGFADGPPVQARYDNVLDTTLCTLLGQGQARFGTVEHLMAALAGCGIDNAVVAVDGPELPILDGSAEQFVFLIDCAGVVEQAAARRVVEVLRTVRVSHGEGWAELRPASPAGGLELAMSIDFAARAIGRQHHALQLTPERFRTELAAARTFTQADEIAQLHARGLALGGDLGNAVVVDGDTVLNPGGLRMQGEFVRHKMLDAIGDLALAGYALHGRFIAHRSGHSLNNRLLHALFGTAGAWQLT